MLSLGDEDKDGAKKGKFPKRDNYGPRTEKESANRLRRDI